MTILLEKFGLLEKKRAALVARSGEDPFHVIVEKVVSATEAVVYGHKVIMVGTNNYLGLSFDPKCVAAACEAVRAR